jgi:hypothetical protein
MNIFIAFIPVLLKTERYIVVKISRKPKGGLGTLLKSAVLAVSLGAGSVAQADTLTFEGTVDSPFVFAGDHLLIGKYWTESYGIGATQTGDLVGMLVNGSDNSICAGLSCPVNNLSQYYAGLDDGYFYFGMQDNSSFKLRSLQASFIGAGQAFTSSIAGLLVLQGFDALGQAVGASWQLALPSPNAAGVFNFNDYDLSATAFGNTDYSYVRILGLSCNSAGSCTNGIGQANFGIDNIVTSAVPEPAAWLLYGLGLLGMGIYARKRGT